MEPIVRLSGRGLAISQGGLVTRAQPARLGWSKDFVTAQLKAERWQAVSRWSSRRPLAR